MSCALPELGVYLSGGDITDSHLHHLATNDGSGSTEYYIPYTAITNTRTAA